MKITENTKLIEVLTGRIFDDSGINAEVLIEREFEILTVPLVDQDLLYKDEYDNGQKK